MFFLRDKTFASRNRTARKRSLCNPWFSRAFFALLGLPLFLFSQNSIVQILRTNESPHIDGELNDAVWQGASRTGGFVQFDPYNGQPASENTILMMAFDSDNLYVAFICEDSNPSGISASLTPREKFDLNDTITLVLDTFNDQRTSYSFTMNPRGVQYDSPGDYIWQSSGRITDQGWQAEMRIPFKSIRFPKVQIQTWKVNVKRFIFRLQETDYLTRVGRDEVFLEKSAELKGLEGIRGGKNLELFPYAGFRMSRSDGESENKFAGGLDLKLGITSDLNLDMTMSPDFSEVESDPFFYQLSPYEYQLSENRPFFQEGSRFFPNGDDGPSLFYSKRIENPRVAAKLTGKQGKYTIGAIGALNKEEGGDGAIGAFSLQRDILKYSKISAMVSGYSTPDFSNLNGRFSLDLNFSDILSWGGTVQRTHNSDRPDRENMNYHTFFHYGPDEGFNTYAEYERIEKNFMPRAGIWGETDRQSLFVNPGYGIRLNRRGIKRIEFEWSGSIEHTTDGMPLGYLLRPVEIELSTMKNFEIGLSMMFGKNKVQILDGEDLVWSGSYYRIHEYELDLDFEGSRYFQFRMEFGTAQSPVYNDEFDEAYDGNEIRTELFLELRPTSMITLGLATEYMRQTRKEDGELVFEGAISELEFEWQLTRQLFFSTLVQHDSDEDRMKIDVLLGLEFGMGNTFSVSYKSRGRMPVGRAISGDEASTLLVKASYLFRL